MTTQADSNYDWSRFSVHVYCEGSVEKIFSRWVTCRGLESFFIKSSSFTSNDGILRKPGEIAQPNDSYRWRWIHDAELEGNIVAVVNDQSITYTFGSMKFTVSLTEADGRTLVRLHQFEIPFATEKEKASNHLNCRSCWVFFLTNLKSVSEHGIDLREQHPLRSDSPSVHFTPPEQDI